MTAVRKTVSLWEALGALALALWHKLPFSTWVADHWREVPTWLQKTVVDFLSAFVVAIPTLTVAVPDSGSWTDWLLAVCIGLLNVGANAWRRSWTANRTSIEDGLLELSPAEMRALAKRLLRLAEDQPF